MNTKEKVMEALFEEPSRKFHIRLLARMTGLNPNTIISITDDLAKEGLLTKQKEKETNLVTIKANPQDTIFKIRKQAYNIEKIHKSGIIKHLEEQLSYPAIILFGSYAKAENHKSSDIDLFIVTEAKKEPDLAAFERRLGAPIQLFIHNKKELKRLVNTNPELMNNVLNGTVLSGFLEVF
ncbi:MAG: nucleotidyltransferase domain-containing protein [Nanoarchaeota archaeon]|nr:nucleotidyltransferase domain-containing protein [Nanoarchaeota archaeon]